VEASRQEEGPIADADPYPLYPDGEREAECVGADVYPDPQFRRWVARLKFQLIPDGEPICGFLNLGSKRKPEAGTRSKYRRAWIIANGAAPRKRQRLSVRAFMGRIFLVRIGQVKTFHDGSDHPAGAVYSIVREILSRTYP